MIALYIRLSVADRGLAPHERSQSVETQEAMLRAFVAGRPGLAGREVRAFVDDGYTGTSPDRPGLIEMLRLARDGQVGCVVVKDFSRLARDYVTAGAILQEELPLLGVRVISAGDGYDSDNPAGAGEQLIVGFKNVFNAGYSYATSERVSAGIESLWRHGKQFSAAVPFGYVWDRSARGHMRVDPGAAAIVRSAFELACAGKRPGAIADELNARGTPTPGEYNFVNSVHGKMKDPGQVGAKWSPAKVSHLLRHEAYTGTLVAHRMSRERVGSDNTVPVPPEEHIRVPDAHDAIVSQRDFELAQRVLGKKGDRRAARRKGILNGRVFCSECGRQAAYVACKRKRDYHRLDCGCCAAPPWTDLKLKAEVKRRIAAYLANLKEEAFAISAARRAARKGKAHASGPARATDDLAERKLAAYDRYVAGELDAAALRAELDALASEAPGGSPEREEGPDALDARGYEASVVALSRKAPPASPKPPVTEELLDMLVRRVTVAPDGRIGIEFKLELEGGAR